MRGFFLIGILCADICLGAGRLLALDVTPIKVAIMQEDYRGAIIEGEKLMAQEGDQSSSVELYYLLGISYLKDGNYLRASDIFEIILSEFPGSQFSQDSRLALGDTYFLRGNVMKAKEIYGGLLEKNSEIKSKSLLFLRLSQCASRLGNLSEAKKYMGNVTDQFILKKEAGFGVNSCSLTMDYYTVQVGVFLKEENARVLKSQLEEKGYACSIENSGALGSLAYRVRVGSFGSRSDAVVVQEKLKAEGYPTKVCP